MGDDKRGLMPPIPDQLDQVLNEMQMLGLRQMENFGWHLLFVRRPLFQEPVPVLIDAAGKRYGLLEQDGHVRMDPDVAIRESVA